MKLTSVQIENYRGIASLSVPLDPQMTVLFGPNGSGKTSVLTAIAACGNLSEYRGRVQPVLDEHVGTTASPDVQLFADDKAWIGAGLHGDGHGNPWWQYVNVDPSCTNFRDRVDALPPCVFYDVDRAVVSSLVGRKVGPQADYRVLFEWFKDMEDQELRLQHRKDKDAKIGSLAAVRTAICLMLEGVSDPHVDYLPNHPVPMLVVKQDAKPDLAFEQLSDGYKGVIALAADIARRLVGPIDVVAEAVLEREALVLIDEIELHLHPEWQQRVLPDLMRTFPNVQFVVSTHSPQVLTTVRPEQIVELGWQDGHIVAGAAPTPTYGAEADYVLSALMNVDKRPPNSFARKFREYMRLIDDGKGESDKARNLRQTLEELSSGDLGFLRADAEIRRQRMTRGTGES